MVAVLFKDADGIVDLRDVASYQQGHLKGSTNIVWTVLPESLNALPAAPAKLFLVGDRDEIEAASVLLDSKGYEVNGSLVVNDVDAMQNWAQALPGQIVSGSDSKTLWSPSSLLLGWQQYCENLAIDPKKCNPRLAALDLGCGGGRDAIFLAKQGWMVTGIDQEARVLKRAKSLAAQSKVNVKFKCCDLKKADCFPQQLFDLIVMVRYLNRELFDLMESQLKPGGYLLIQTFVEGVESFGSPKNPNFILAKNELAERFSHFSIIHNQQEVLADGRPVISFIAQKPDGV